MDSGLLAQLCGTYGPSGHEEKIRNFIRNKAAGLGDEVFTDPMGNLIVHKKGPGKKMMLAAHMDQIGMMVTHIDKNGFVYFTKIGGLSAHSCHGQMVIFANGQKGVISCKRLEDIKKMDLSSLYIDIGAATGMEAEKKVSVGDVCVFSRGLESFDTVVVSPALDDRLGCYILLEVLSRIKNPAFDLYFAFTVQEEVGLRGAKTAAYTVEPDYALAFDITISFDTPNALKMPAKLGKGPAIKLKDASLLCHPAMIKHLERCAKENGIVYQYEILEHGGTDTGAIHTSRGGVVSGALSVPIRYTHSAVEMANIHDVEDTVLLCVKALEQSLDTAN